MWSSKSLSISSSRRSPCTFSTLQGSSRKQAIEGELLLTQTEVYDQIVESQKAGRKVAVATIITTSGSTPQRTGAKLLVFEDGRMLGTVGGGCVEADVWAEARSALAEDSPRLCKFSLRDAPDVLPDEEGMICGGDMEVLIEIW